MPTLFLIDTFSLLFQVFHAIPSMTSPKGLPANAVFGFTRDLFNFLKQHKPTHWVCAMDSPGDGVRNEIYPEYKANRTEMPDDLRPQIEMVQRVMAGFGIPTIGLPGWEADDVIATLTRLAVERGWEVRIVTNDKDARQLLGPRVKLFNVRKNTWYEASDLKIDWGVRPDQVIDFQSLVGDSVDNVPGVPFVGPKKATVLLEQFGTLDDVLANADNVAGDKLKSNLKEFAHLAHLSRELVTLNQHLPLDLDWDAMRTAHVDAEQLAALFHEYGFRRFIDEARSLPAEHRIAVSETTAISAVGAESQLTLPALHVEIVDSDDKLTELISALSQQREYCLDVAASSRHAAQADIVGLTFCWESGQAWFVPVSDALVVAEAVAPVLVAAVEDSIKAVEPTESDDVPVVETAKKPKQRSLFDELDDEPSVVADQVLGSADELSNRADASGLKGQNKSAQGNALRTNRSEPSSPESAKQFDDQQTNESVSPLGGFDLLADANPERCPGLVCSGPSDQTADVNSGERRKQLLERLRPILESADIAISNHDLKFDLVVLRRAGLHVIGLGVDPMLASYLLEAGARSHDLPGLADRYLHQKLSPFPSSSNDVATLAKSVGGATIPQSGDRSYGTIPRYFGERCEAAFRLSRKLSDELKSNNLWELYWALERPLLGVLAEMEANGIRVDVDELQRQSAELASRLSVLMTEIYQLAGHEFNIDSPKQLAKVLFEELNLPVLKKLKTGPSTDQDVLEKLALVHPLPAKLTEHRQLTKLRGTYLDALPLSVNPRTGKIHTTFHQAVAATGRLGSADPNLQNIPIRSAEGQRVRRAFVPSEPGWQFVAADYSQIELRMLAHFSGDAAMCKAFATGIDIHTAVACEVFNLEPSNVTPEQRRIAKAVNFGVIYGQTAFGLSEALHIDQVEAALFIDQYFVKYAGVDEYISRTLAEVARTGFATTILGRRRAISGIRPQRKKQLNMSERTAINTVIQGSAADLIKQAMLRVHDRLRAEKNPGRLLLQIHDELFLECPAADVASLTELVRTEMQSAMTLRVPLVVDVSSGDNWQEA